MEWIWVGVIIALVLVELVSLTFTSMWFVMGAVVSFILAKLEKSYGIQLTAFLSIGIILLIFIRPLVYKQLNKFKQDKISKIFNKYPFLNYLVDVDIEIEKKKKNSKHKVKKSKK